MASNPAKGDSRRHVRLVWHRRDLRLHDNWLYRPRRDARDGARLETVGLYVFNENDFRPRPAASRPDEWDAVNTGPHACRFLLESVRDLRRSLRARDSELLVRYGNPLDVLSELVRRIRPNELCWNEEPGVYETKLSDDVKEYMKHCHPHVDLYTSMEYTLYHPNDLPVGGQEWEQLAQPNKKRSKRNKRPQSPPRDPLPLDVVDVSQSRWRGQCRIMGDFRRAARTKAKPRNSVPESNPIICPDFVGRNSASAIGGVGDIPTFDELMEPLLRADRPILGLPHSFVLQSVQCAKDQLLQSSTDKVNRVFRGGETNGLAHLQDFVANHAAAAVRNLACVDDNQSSHLSAYLAFGCLSPRRVVEEAEANGEDCNWLISHMTMRDFFLYTCLATGPSFYHIDGISINKKRAGKLIQWKPWKDVSAANSWERWATGDTGLPLVDAAMRELHKTGYCSNRVRQNAASLLTKDLGIDWRAGAELFQLLLGDHCVGANWGNWLYFSGVGPDPKHRHFRTISQALKYDPDGRFVRKWVDELKALSDDEAHLRPWDYTTNWRKPLVGPETQYVWQDLERLKESGRLLSD